MTTARDGSSDSQEPQYLTKKVVLNGQTVTLYSVNGATWLSSPDQLPDVMARLENTRILLTDTKAAAEQGITPQPAAPKAPAARYRMKGPKPRPILQPDGTLLPPSERAPVAAVDTTVTLSSDGVEVLDDSPAARIKQLRAPKEEAKKAAAKAAKVGAKAALKETKRNSKSVVTGTKALKVKASEGAVPSTKSAKDKSKGASSQKKISATSSSAKTAGKTSLKAMGKGSSKVAVKGSTKGLVKSSSKDTKPLASSKMQSAKLKNAGKPTAKNSSKGKKK